MLGQSVGIGQIAKATGVSRQTVYRIKDDPMAAEASFGELEQARSCGSASEWIRARQLVALRRHFAALSIRVSIQSASTSI
jgi:hypothetical protein